MQLLDFREFSPFNQLREKMDTAQLGYFELFDPAIHLTGSERSELNERGMLKRLDEIRVLPDKTLAIKNSRVLIYNPDENYYRNSREYPTYHVAHCSFLLESAREQPDLEFLATTRLAEDYDLLKIRPSGEISVSKHGFVVCKHCLHKLRYKDFDEFRNRKRGYSEKVLKSFRLEEFFALYTLYPLSFGRRPELEESGVLGE
jgi:hypothetical protein